MAIVLVAAARSVLGSVEHQVRTSCAHTCDATCRDDPKLSRREAVAAAVRYWEEHVGRRSDTSLH